MPSDRDSPKTPLQRAAEVFAISRVESPIRGLSKTDGIGTGKLRRAVALLKRYLHDARIGEAPEQDRHRARREGLRLPRLLPVARPAHGGTGDRRALPRTCHPALRARAGPTAKVSPARVVSEGVAALRARFTYTCSGQGRRMGPPLT